MGELKFKDIKVDKCLDDLRVESLKESYVDEVPSMSKWSLNSEKVLHKYKGMRIEEDEESYGKTLKFNNLVERRTKKPFKDSYKNLQEADYIKIGNKIYPNTSMDFGNRSAEQVLADTERRYNQEQAEREEAALKADLAEKAKPILVEIEAGLKGDEKDLDVLFKHLVPNTGKAETVAGELVRAMMRILYRDFNDGDIFYDGYGKEACASSAAYLCKTLPEEFEEDFIAIVENDLVEDEYTAALEDISRKLIDYIMDNPDLLATPNTDDSRFSKEDEDYFDDYVSRHEYDCDISGDYIEKYLEYGKISWDDIEDAISNFLQDQRIASDKIRRWAYDGIIIEDLTPSEYEIVEKEFPAFFDNYLNDLENEFGSPYDLEDEEEEEEEIEEEDEE